VRPTATFVEVHTLLVLCAQLPFRRCTAHSIAFSPGVGVGVCLAEAGFPRTPTSARNQVTTYTFFSGLTAWGWGLLRSRSTHDHDRTCNLPLIHLGVRCESRVMICRLLGLPHSLHPRYYTLGQRATDPPTRSSKRTLPFTITTTTSHFAFLHGPSLPATRSATLCLVPNQNP
jgi:hypothetical protein